MMRRELQIAGNDSGMLLLQCIKDERELGDLGQQDGRSDFNLRYASRGGQSGVGVRVLHLIIQ